MSIYKENVHKPTTHVKKNPWNLCVGIPPNHHPPNLIFLSKPLEQRLSKRGPQTSSISSTRKLGGNAGSQASAEIC